MKTNRKLRTAALVSLVSLVGVSCGGGSGGGQIAGGGIGGTGITAAGTITGFGSIFVNNLEFDLNNATITRDGDPVSESDLQIGMVVTVTGTLNADGKTAKANSVEANDEVEGPVTSVGANQLVVLGQTVIADATTIVEQSGGGNIPLSSIASGNVVEVSGFKNSGGQIVATRIELKQSVLQPGDNLELKGPVSNVDFGSMTFSVGGQTVDFSTAQLEDLNGGTLNDGDQVEVKGNSLNNGALIATRVEGIGSIAGKGNDEAEIEGLVTDLANSDEFTLNGQPVRLNTGTQFKNGTINDIDIDSVLEVEGTIGADGVLSAAEVKIKGSPGEADDGSDTGHNSDSGSDDNGVDGEDSGSNSGSGSDDGEDSGSNSGSGSDDGEDSGSNSGSGSDDGGDSGGNSGSGGGSGGEDDGSDDGGDDESDTGSGG